MRVLVPANITDALLISSSIAETDYAAWSGATAYAVGNRVIRTTTHRIYERLIAGTTAAAPEADPVNWIDVGPTNRWAMFDPSTSDVSSATGSIAVTLNAGTANSVVLVGSIGTSVRVAVGATVLATVAVPAPIAPSTSSTVLIEGLAIVTGQNITVTLTGTGTVSTAYLGVGMSYDIGGTVAGPEISLYDYSVKATDRFGVTTITRRAYSRRIRAAAVVPTTSVDTVAGILEALRARICFWSVHPSVECLRVLGWYRDWGFDVRNGGTVTYSITLEGLARDDMVLSPGQVVSGATPQVAGASATASLGDVVIKWNDGGDVRTEIRVGATWEAGTTIFVGQATSFVWKGQPFGTYTLHLKHLSSGGAYSAADTVVTVTLVVLATPVVTAAISGPDEIISWTVPASAYPIDTYEIRYGTSFAAGVSLGTVKGTMLRRRADYLGSRTYWVNATDTAGNVSVAGSATLNIAAPSAPQGGRAEVIDNNALLFWSPPATGTLPIADYDVRKGAVFASSTDLGSNAISTFSAVFEQAAGTYTYWIVPIDTAGNTGTPSSITASISQPPDFVLRTNINSTLTMGTRTNLALEFGRLIGPFDTVQTRQAKATAGGWANIQAKITAGFTQRVTPNLATATYDESFDAGTLLPPTVITVTPSMSTIAGSVAIGVQIYYRTLATDAWTAAAPGSSVLAPAFRFYRVVLTLTAAVGNNLAQITAMNVRLSVKLRSDSGTGTITNAATGVTVPFGVAFLAADTPIVQPTGTVPLIPVVDYTATPNPTSFVVKLFTIGGAATTGSFSWTARGY